MVVARGWGEGGIWSYYLMGMEFQLEKIRKFWRLMVAMVSQQCECTSCHRTVHFKVTKMVIFTYT